MSAKARIAVVLAAAAVAAAAFVVLQPGDADRAGEASPSSPTEVGTDGASAEPEPPPVTRIEIRAGAVVGEPAQIEVRTGETVRVVVASDAPDEIHLHGYDITRQAAPGKPARFRFTAGLEGAFEMESHELEHGGGDPLVARLAVGPA